MFQNRGFVCVRRRRSHTNLQGWIPCGYPCVHPEIENFGSLHHGPFNDIFFPANGKHTGGKSPCELDPRIKFLLVNFPFSSKIWLVPRNQTGSGNSGKVLIPSRVPVLATSRCKQIKQFTNQKSNRTVPSTSPYLSLRLVPRTSSSCAIAVLELLTTFWNRI